MKNMDPGHTRPVVCLDAGHFGKYNPGAVEGYYESEMNWALHKLLASELERYGITVKKTRQRQDADMSLTQRGRSAKGADLLLSIHSNGVDGKPEVDYPVAYCNVDGGVDKLGTALANAVQDLMGTKQPGRIYKKVASSGHGDWYTVLAASKAVGVPGVILEHSFHTNPAACAWLMKVENLQALAKAEASIIADWFGIHEKEDHLYRVRRDWEDAKSQIGAYKVLGNAVRACKEGYAVYDETGAEVYSRKYTVKDFVLEVQEAVGAAVDGIAGPETLSKTVTVSAKVNSRHRVVKAIQKRLHALGYTEVGEPDGIAGPKFTDAVKAYQKNGGGAVDGEITARQRTWKRLLGMQ